MTAPRSSRVFSQGERPSRLIEGGSLARLDECATLNKNLLNLHQVLPNSNSSFEVFAHALCSLFICDRWIVASHYMRHPPCLHCCLRGYSPRVFRRCMSRQ